METPCLYSNTSSELQLLEDQLAAILVTEESYQIPCMSCTSDRLSLTEEWRRKICQWSFRVIDHFRLDREVVSFGLNLFDRFLTAPSQSQPFSSKNTISRHQNNPDKCECSLCAWALDSRTYQLAAMTSLYVAIKLHPDNTAFDGVRKKRCFKLESFVELSRGQFGATDICNMETQLLSTLKWKVHPPTPMSLVAFLLMRMPPIGDIPSYARPTYELVIHVLQELSRYITELSVCLGNLCSSCRPSQVAYAAILVSMDLLTLQALPLRTRDTFHAAVSLTSVQSGGTMLTPHKTKVRRLSSILSKSLLPELLLEEFDAATSVTVDPTAATPITGNATSNTASKVQALAGASSSSCHPILIAREYGLLNLSKIHLVHHENKYGLDSSSKREIQSLESSPTGVNQPCY